MREEAAGSQGRWPVTVTGLAFPSVLVGALGGLAPASVGMCSWRAPRAERGRALGSRPRHPGGQGGGQPWSLCTLRTPGKENGRGCGDGRGRRIRVSLEQGARAWAGGLAHLAAQQLRQMPVPTLCWEILPWLDVFRLLQQAVRRAARPGLLA